MGCEQSVARFGLVRGLAAGPPGGLDTQDHENEVGSRPLQFARSGRIGKAWQERKNSCSVAATVTRQVNSDRG